MPNTGRFYAPAAAAAFRERYMRPYSTVSAPVGGHHAPPSLPKMAAPPQYSRTSFRRSEEEQPHGVFSTTAFDSRIRGRSNGSMDRSYYDEERRWPNGFPEKALLARQQQPWRAPCDDTTPTEPHQIPTIRSVRPLDATRRSQPNMPSMVGTYAPASEGFNLPKAPSTLPCLSSFLKRTMDNTDTDNRFPEDRKRPRDASPSATEFRQPATKQIRRFYEPAALPAKLADGSRNQKNLNLSFARLETRDSPTIVSGDSPSFGNTWRTEEQLLPSGAHARAPSSSSLPSRRFEDQEIQYSHARMDEFDGHHAQPSSATPPRERRYDDAAAVESPASLVVRNRYGEQERELTPHRHRDCYSPETQLSRGSTYKHPTAAALSSPPQPSLPVPLQKSRATTTTTTTFTAVAKYANSHDSGSGCVIEAAADLIEERSPSKRESITKLLLKSKEFLKAKSLVRNRNNEIDWVATFLNVGFESNSIYSLMCPLRKGRWKVEEEKYTMELLRLIENGTIRLGHGQSIRGFIAKKLHSDDMRVLKKLSNCKMFHFARLINPQMSEDQEIDETQPNARANLDRLDKLKAEFLRSVQLEALVAVRKYLSDTSIRDLLNARD